MDIIIDTKGNFDLLNRDQLQNDADNDDIEINSSNIFKSFDISRNLVSDIIEEEKPKKKKVVSSSKDFDLEQFETDMGWKSSKAKWKYKPMKDLVNLRQEVNPIDKILEKSRVLKPDFEQLHVVPPYELSKRKLEIRKQREKRKMGAGAGWANMRTPHLTKEILHDLEALQMRSALDPKRFYKKKDIQALPKHFHIGKVVDSPMDFYSSRLTKKERKNTFVDELMADAELMKYNKRKFKEIVGDRNKKTHSKAHKHAKRLKERKRK